MVIRAKHNIFDTHILIFFNFNQAFRYVFIAKPEFFSKASTASVRSKVKQQKHCRFFLEEI